MEATNAQENCFICKKSLTAPKKCSDNEDEKDSKTDATQEIVDVKDDIETLRNASKQKKDGHLKLLQSTKTIDVHKSCFDKYIDKVSEVHHDTSDEEEEEDSNTDEDDDDEACNTNGDFLSYLSSAMKSTGVRLDKPIPRLKKLPAHAASNQIDSDDESGPFGGMDAMEYLGSVYKSMMPPGIDLTKPIPRKKRSGD